MNKLFFLAIAVIILFSFYWFTTSDRCITDSDCQVKTCTANSCENKYGLLFSIFLPKPVGCVATEFWAKSCGCFNFKCRARINNTEARICHTDAECVMASFNAGPDLPSIFCECTNIKLIDNYIRTLNPSCQNNCFCNATSNLCQYKSAS